VTGVVQCDNQAGIEGAKAIAEALKKKNTLQWLWLVSFLFDLTHAALCSCLSGVEA
jgi:hypothetical protein